MKPIGRWMLPFLFLLTVDTGLEGETRGVNISEPILYCDMTSLMTLDLEDPAERRRFWDTTHLVSAFQGLLNREAPRLYLRYNAEPDDFWWKIMRREGGWLEKAEVREIGLDELLALFPGDSHKGFVVWDEQVPATSNLASTLAGAENLLPLRYDTDEHSLYRRLTQKKDALPVVVRLINDDGSPLFTGKDAIPGTGLPSTGSAKCDAYVWLLKQAMEKGRLNPHVMGYYLDGFWLNCWHAGAPQNHTLANHDYIVSQKGFFFDLNVWEDEAPVDDPSQAPGTDLDTFKRVLGAAYDRFQGKGVIHVAGFVPWAYKYTTFQTRHWSAGGNHDPVPTEWKYAEILSCFNAYMDADALGYSSMANASFFQHRPLPRKIPQNAKPTKRSLKAAGVLDAKGRIRPKSYVAHYVGDYDSTAWLYWNIPRFWNDPQRGQVTLSWAFNPNLCDRFPVGMLWTRQSRTERDFFVAGDSGAGYLNAGYLSEPRPHSGLPSGVNAWETHCRKLFKQWDITLTGFVLDGYARGLTGEGLDAYARFSPDGIVPQKIPPQGVHRGMPYIRMGADLPHGEKDAAELIVRRSGGTLPRFAVHRSILKPPSWYKKVEEETEKLAGDRVVFVDMYTLLWLVERFEKNPSRHEIDMSVYEDKAVLFGEPGTLEGVSPVWWEDGPFRAVAEKGVPCWKISGRDREQYLYFDVGLRFPEKGPKEQVVVEVEYLDREDKPFLLQYDSADPTAPGDGAYKDASPEGPRQDSGAWKRERFALRDARFRGGQNGGADLRLFARGAPLLVRRISVTRPGD